MSNTIITPEEKAQNKKRSLLFSVIAILLAVTVGVLPHGPIARIIAESKQAETEYVGDVKVYTAASAEQARSLCEKDGYIPVDGDLNAGGEGDSVILGYQKTTDVSEAVTDIRMMQMTSGFSTLDYTEVVSRQYPQLDGFIADEYAVINEFAERLESGSINAGIARAYLNLFTIPETGMKLGDYFTSGSVDKKLLKKLFLQSTTAVTTTIMGQLTLGVADTPDDTWAGRVYKVRESFDAPHDEETEEEQGGDPYAELDSKYLNDTERLVAVLQDYATKYQNAMVRASKNGGKLPEITTENSTPEEMNDKGTDSIYVLAHDMLNQFKYNDEIMLGDWLVEMGCMKLSKKNELRQLYPLTAAMSYGQLLMTEITGICNAALYLGDMNTQKDELKHSLNEAKEACRELDGEEVISVWSGVDQDMFSRKVAVTGDAQRYTNLKNTADNMVKRNKAIQVMENVVSIAQTSVSIAGGVASLLIIPSTLVEVIVADAALWYCEHFTAYMIFTCMGKVAAIIGKISTIVLIVALIVMVIVWIYEALAPECDDLTYTDIPEIAMDLNIDEDKTKSNGMLRYDLIRGPDGKADLNAYSGKQWNALYYSKNADAGNPVTVPEDGSAFIVQENNSINPKGYAPVKNFDEVYAANLNANVRSKKANQIYLFYSSPGSKADTTVVPEDEKEDKDNKEEQKPEEEDSPDGYISTLYLSNADNETEAKLNLTKKGYKTIDVNLTPSIGTENFFGKEIEKSYTYLGYTLTKKKEAAVTDIRVVKLKSANQGLMYGNVKYTAAGYDGHDYSICYTKDSNAGSPIPANQIQVVDKLSDAKKGSVPVCLIGGPAYNFDNSAENTKWDNSKYVFFTPSEDNNTDKEYLAGLFFVEGRDAKESGYSLEDYAKRLGGKLIDVNLTKGKTWQQRINGANYTALISIEDFRSYLCYTTTHDPKRALYDIKLYTGAPKMNYFMPNITALTGFDAENISQSGYGVASVFIQNKGNIINQSGTASKEDMYHFDGNVFNDYLATNSMTHDCFGQKEDNALPGIKWDAVLCQPKALYASGWKEECEPLTVKDIRLDSGKAPEGYTSVRDFKYPYEKKPINLSYFFSEKSDECSKAYLYIKRPAPVKGKYIASLSLASYNPSSDWSEEERKANDMMSDDICYINLLSASSGGIINQNLAVNPQEAWYNATDKKGYGSTDYTPKAAYLGATYTDDPRRAIHGIIRKTVDDSTPKDTIKVGGATYSLVKNLTSTKPLPVTSPNGRQYYLYTSTSTGASPAAAPLTEIDISEDVFKSGMATVLTVDHGDVQKETDRYGKTIKDEELVTPYGDANDSLYMHVNTDDHLLGIDTFYVGSANSKKKAQADLLSQGAVYCLPLDLNKGVTSSPNVFIGYSKYDPDFTKTKRTKYYMELAIKDLYIYKGSDPKSSIKVDGRKYTLVSENSLNAVTPMYLYQTTALINNKNKDDASYITSVAAAQYDRVPEDIADNRWENLLTTDNEKIDLNYGSVGFDGSDEMHVVDTRIHAFVHRNDNYIKPEGVITGGYSTEMTLFGDMILTKN